MEQRIPCVMGLSHTLMRPSSCSIKARTRNLYRGSSLWVPFCSIKKLSLRYVTVVYFFHVFYFYFCSYGRLSSTLLGFVCCRSACVSRGARKLQKCAWTTFAFFGLCCRFTALRVPVCLSVGVGFCCSRHAHTLGYRGASVTERGMPCTRTLLC